MLKQKKYEAVMIPQISNRYDVSQFSEDFTNQKAVDGPADNGPPNGPNASRYFKGKIKQKKNFSSTVAYDNLFLRLFLCGTKVQETEHSYYST